MIKISRANLHIRVIFIFVILTICSWLVAGQNVRKCRVEDKNARKIKYFSGAMLRIPETGQDPAILSLYIAIKPNQFNKEYLILLASKLKAEFCQETNLVVSIFDSKYVARDYNLEYQEA